MDHQRTLIFRLDHDLQSNLARLSAALTNTMGAVNCGNILRKLRQELKDNKSPEQSEQLQQAISELESSVREKQTRFNGMVQHFLEQLKEQDHEWRESEFVGSFQEAFILKREDLDRLVKYSNEQVAPLLRALGAELAVVDAKVAELADTNFFDEAVKLLPSSKAVSDINISTPEGGLLNAGYESVLSLLRMLGERQRLSDLLARRKDLAKRRDFLKEIYQNCEKEYQQAEGDLTSLRALWSLYTNISTYMEQINNIRLVLEPPYERLVHTAKASISSEAYLGSLREFETKFQRIGLL